MLEGLRKVPQGIAPDIELLLQAGAAPASKVAVRLSSSIASNLYRRVVSRDSTARFPLGQSGSTLPTTLRPPKGTVR